MFSNLDCSNKRIFWLGIALGVCGAGSVTGWAQNTLPATDPPKAYSTIGITSRETLRLDVVNIGGTNGIPPGPCNVQMGFVNAAGTLLKNSDATIAAGQAAFLTITYAEAAAALTTAQLPARLNIRPVLNTVPPGPCRSVASAEVFDGFLGRAHVFAVPLEAPDSTPPANPEFGIMGMTALDTIRLNVTNIIGSSGLPPGPCNVQMGFVNGAGIPIKTAAATVEAGHTAALTVNYSEAGGSTFSSNGLAKVSVRPTVIFAPPCRVASAEMIDVLTGLTVLYVHPSFQPAFPTPW